MPILLHYTALAKEAFNQFLDNQIDSEALIEKLRYLELQVLADDEEETGSGIWFRFFEGDTLQTTIAEIEKDLSDPAHPNYKILLQGIALGIEADELEVHYE